MSAVTSILTSEGKGLVSDLQKSMQDKGLNASGETSRSIHYTVESTTNKEILKIIANRSIGALQHGRRAGGFPPINIIRKWIDDKPVSPQGNISSNQLAFLIARKIARIGIRVPNRYNPGGVISDVINDSRIDEIFFKIKQASKNRLIEAMKQTKAGFAK